MKLTLSLIALLSLSSYSAEIDSYTNRGSIFKRDSSSFINEDINSRLKIAVKALNTAAIDCPTSPKDASKVYKIVKKSINSTFIGHSIAVRYEETLPESHKIYTPWEESIYSDITLWQGISLKLKGILSTMKVKGNIVGVDKLGHFFVEGWAFYKRAYLKNDTIDINKAINWGQMTERTYFGMTTTGIYSNADLIANFNGMRFWNRLLGFDQDPIGENRPAYLTCEDRDKWKINSNFNIKDYIDSAMDESVNCNYYDTDKIMSHVTDKVKDSFTLKSFFFKNFRYCPIRKSKCRGLADKYKEFASELLHDACYDEN